LIAGGADKDPLVRNYSSFFRKHHPVISIPFSAAPMWFKNLLVYRLPPDWATSRRRSRKKRLPASRCKPAAVSTWKSRGWVCPRSEGRFLHTLNRQVLLARGCHQKLLPAAASIRWPGSAPPKSRSSRVTPLAASRCGTSGIACIRNLLPRAFTRLRTTRAWIDPVNGWLAIDAAVKPGRRADQGTCCSPWTTCRSSVLRLAFTGFGHDPLAGGGGISSISRIDQDLELRSSDEGNATVRYVRHALEGKEIRDHIAAARPPRAWG